MNSSKSYFLKFTVLGLCLIGYALYARADEKNNYPSENVTAPEEVQSHIPKEFYPIYLNDADLNGDGRSDYLMVLENISLKGQDNWTPDRDTNENLRPLVILQRTESGSLEKVKQNDKVVLCRFCGGVFGDPFESIEVTKKGFIVHLYGGSNWRWSYDYEFAYSRIDKTWQLVSATEGRFFTAAPDEQEIKKYQPPKDFGKIDLADFDPMTYLPDRDKKE